ncbi:hypothetical protein L1049_024440 [Liquidambar formosana]|uniref:Uncharacterized protein n=1 Tax=Liquidambar formosana TaxID=63359 RepID=A0AAP0X196_LIQFO
MAISLRGNHCLLSRLKSLLQLQRFNHTMVEGGLQAQFYREMGSDSVPEKGHIDTSKWKKVDSRVCGITRSMISPSSWIVLKLLQSEGFEAYLVGGCVRDLLLNKVPKDFDVITTANLKQIRKQFHRAEIVGRRFPICRVHVKGSVIEVSSFETVAKHAEEKEKYLFSQMPRGCDKKDLIRWRNCMHRDFTVNSLFFNPFVNKIYDYANGMTDLRSLKNDNMQTLFFAARILRGLRIAARLGLSLSKETENAIRSLSSSIKSLDKSRIMLELNYMLSYGAAEPSLCLLQRFNLLEILLPFHAAYLTQQANKQSAWSTVMLMKLFFNLDKLLTCDQPSNCILWVGLLAFHLALVNNPQDALVVWTFSSVMYHGRWKEGVMFAREYAQLNVNFMPEISEPCDYKSDEELAKKVAQLASLVRASIDALTETDSLYESMSRYPVFPCSGLVFVSKKTGKDVDQIFKFLTNDIESFEEGRGSFKIKYHLLGKGDLRETRFVLGKVIMDTMSSGVVQGGMEVVEEKDHLNTFDYKQKPDAVEENCHVALSDLIKHQIVVKEDIKRSLSPSKPEVQKERVKKQKLIERCNIAELETAKKKRKAVKKMKLQEIAKEQEVVENRKGHKMTKKHQEVTKKGNCCVLQDEVTKKQMEVVEMSQLSQEEIIMMGENVLEKEEFRTLQLEISEKQRVKCQEGTKKHLKGMKANFHISPGEVIKKQKMVVEKCHLTHDEIIEPEDGEVIELEDGEKIQSEEVFEKNKCHLPQKKVVRKKHEKHKQLFKENRSQPLLSSLFK